MPDIEIAKFFMIQQKMDHNDSDFYPIHLSH